MAVSGWKCDLGRNVEAGKVSHSRQSLEGLCKLPGAFQSWLSSYSTSMGALWRTRCVLFI